MPSDSPLGAQFKYVLIDCRIPAGKSHEKSASKAMQEIANINEPGWFGVDPAGAECLRCHAKWETDPLAHPEDLTCSNCYSDNIVIIAVRITRWSQYDREFTADGVSVDTERLDWLACQGETDLLVLHDEGEPPYRVGLGDGDVYFGGTTLRSAIDAARAASEDGNCPRCFRRRVKR